VKTLNTSKLKRIVGLEETARATSMWTSHRTIFDSESCVLYPGMVT